MSNAHGAGTTELRAALTEGALLTSPEALRRYRTDRTQAGPPGTPLAVVLAGGVADVQATLRWATRTRTPVVPRGAGTGLTGGANAVDGCIVLSLERMTRVEVDVATRTVHAEAGALTSEVKAAARAEGLMYPPDPLSATICTIGGNIATNAGGLCCVKYGVTMDYVLGLDVVLADGRLVRVGGTLVKDVAGLALVELFVGSEGTLGVVVGATLRLLPRPAPSVLIVAAFPSVDAAAHAAVDICRQTRPSMLELIDHTMIGVIEDDNDLGLPREAGAVLLGTSDAPGAGAHAEVETMRGACDQHAATHVSVIADPHRTAALTNARRAVFDAVARLGEYVFEDVAVAVPRLPDLLSGIAHIAQRHRLQIPVVAHAGDGNVHPTIVVPREDPDAHERAYAAFVDIQHLATDLGGSVTGEFGVGRLKNDGARRQLGPEVLELTRGIKAVFDPLGLLNPGVGS